MQKAAVRINFFNVCKIFSSVLVCGKQFLMLLSLWARSSAYIIANILCLSTPFPFFISLTKHPVILSVPWTSTLPAHQNITHWFPSLPYLPNKLNHLILYPVHSYSIPGGTRECENPMNSEAKLWKAFLFFHYSWHSVLFYITILLKVYTIVANQL